MMSRIDTSRRMMGHADFVSTIPAPIPAPSEACTEIGADYDGAAPEGAAIVLLWAVALVAVAAGLVMIF